MCRFFSIGLRTHQSVYPATSPISPRSSREPTFPNLLLLLLFREISIPPLQSLLSRTYCPRDPNYPAGGEAFGRRIRARGRLPTRSQFPAGGEAFGRRTCARRRRGGTVRDGRRCDVGARICATTRRGA
ncbi:hypothetical protein BRADI_5g07845v3 [Brachypodium distachyon]|uniref:Uncharacterized protein n=1 Tax=Brachypodium distachyon TaxID=15368 RepID=A0A0Q3P0Q1_BRADI|nr:hypothetical protein BRADI_5g07845v3 [Brachypodium distachyon]